MRHEHGSQAARIFNGALAAVIAVSFAIQLVVLLDGGKDANSGDRTAQVAVGTRLVRLFSYFTIESNLFVLVIALSLAFAAGRDGRLWRIVRLDSLLGIIITGLVFDLVLARQVHLSGGGLWATIGFHYVAPWGALIGWLAFGPRPRVTSWATVVAAFVWPIGWIVYTFVRGSITGWYPYPFLDAATKGYATAILNTSLVIVLGVVLAVLIKWVDRLPAFGAARQRPR